MKRKIVLVIAAAIAVSLSFGSVSLAQAPVELKLLAWNAMEAAKNQQSQAWDMFNRIEKNSNGKIKFKFLGGTEVVAQADQAEALRLGALCDVLMTAGSFMTSVTPEGRILGVHEMNGKEIRSSGLYDLLNEAFHKRNIHYLSPLDSYNFLEFNMIFLNEPITKPEDLKGKRIITSASQRPVVDAFGAVPLSTPTNEIYSAMERKLASGYIYIVSPAFFSYGLDKVTQYFVRPGWGHGSTGTFFNWDKFRALPPEYQKLINDTAIAVEQEWESKWSAVWQKDLDAYKKSKMKEIRLAPDVGKRLQAKYFDAQWETILKQCPEYGPKAKKLISDFHAKKK
jgi:TRAP-type C4-dicarboxylate transport system substrate-binding protein